MEKPTTQARLPIPLESDRGRRYEQIERLVMDNETIPDWSSFEATKEKTREVCTYVLLEIEKEEAVLEPIHLSMLKRQITIYKGLSESDYRGTGPTLRLGWIQSALKRG